MCNRITWAIKYNLQNSSQIIVDIIKTIVFIFKWPSIGQYLAEHYNIVNIICYLIYVLVTASVA